MSYDVMIGDRYENYTSNMAELFIDFHVYPPSWEGRNRHEVAAEISTGIRRIIRQREIDRAAFDERYDAPNGWGSVHTALGFLLRCYLGATAEIPDTIDVSW